MIPWGELNPEQAAAVRHTDGPLLVYAGAGTGKTRVITFRIAHLWSPAGGGADPAKILGITFTNRAAKEMRERLASIVPRRIAKSVTLTTFHAFGLQVLRRHGSLIGLRHGFSILTEPDKRDVMRTILSRIHDAHALTPLEDLSAQIGLWKNAGLHPEDADELGSPSDVFDLHVRC
jgi:superfamily I DNA/RNA helicase